MMNKMMKKLAIAIAAATMTIASLTCIASANDGMGIDTMKNVTVQNMDATKYVISSIGANVRTKPSTDGELITSLGYNTPVRVDGITSNGWYQVIVSNPNGGESGGYISADLLSDAKGAEIVTPAPSNNGVNSQYTWIKETNSSHSSQVQQERGQMSHDNDTFTACVSSGYLALRSEPKTDPTNEIGQIQNGQMVQVQNYGTQFDYVYVPATGQYGYVNNDYLG